MLVVQGEALRRNVLSEEGATTGVGDFRLGAYTGLLEEPFRLALGVSVGLPTGDPTPTDDDGGGPDITGLSLPTGDGESEVVFELAAGHGIAAGALSLFGQAVVGYALRTTPRSCPADVLEGADCDDFTDQILSRFEVGARITEPGFDRFLLIARLGGIFLLGDAKMTGQVGLGDGVSYVALGPELIVDIIAGFSVSAGVDFGLAGTNVPAGTQLKFGLAFQN
jgi:hypothetical protein